MPEQSLLWVDDNIEKFQPWIDRFEASNVRVMTGRSLQDAYNAVDVATYDAIFLDQMMPGGEGTEGISRIALKAQGCAVFVTSAFLYLDHVMNSLKEREEELGISIGRIDKSSLPWVDDADDVQRFLADIFAEHPYGKISGAARDPEVLLASGIGDVLWDDYSKLDIPGKFLIHERVAVETQESRARYFDAGFSYLVFCGSWSEPVIKEKSLSKFRTEHELLRLARGRGHAPFVFSRGGSVDDLTGNCSLVGGLRGYPALKMERKGVGATVHLDSGNPLSLLSYEWYTMQGWLNPNLTLDVHFAGELKLYGKHQRLDDVIFTDSAERTLHGELTSFSVINWEQLRLASRCHSDCEQWNGSGVTAPVCRYRTALLGRTLAEDLDCDFEVSFRSGSVLFRRAAP